MGTNWTHTTPLVSSEQYSSAMLPARIEGANPSDPTQDSFGQISVAAIIAEASNPAQESATIAETQAVIATNAANAAAQDAADAAASASQALASLGVQNLLDSVPTGLPYEVTGISGGVGTGSGGTPGVYAGGVAGGPSGFAWIYTIDSTGAYAGDEITNRGISISNTLPVLSLPYGGLTGATVPTASVGTISVGRTFAAVTEDGDNLAVWMNSAGSLAPVLDPTGEQVATPTSAQIAKIRSRIAAKPGPSRRVTIDPNGYALEIVTKTQFSNPDINAIRTNATEGEAWATASKPRLTSKPGPTRRVIVDASGYALEIVTKTKINHPDINTIREEASAAAASALPRPRIRLISNHGGWNTIGVSQSNGSSQTSATDRLAFTVGTPCHNPRFIFANGYEDSTAQLNPNGNALSFSAAFEQAPQLAPVSAGSVTASPISTGGKSAHVIGDGEMVISEVVSYGQLVPGTVYYYRVYKTVSSGQKWPYTLSSALHCWLPTGAALRTTDTVYGVSGAGGDATASYGATMVDFTTTAYAWGAVGIVGEQVVSRPVVLVTGDSIAGGTGQVVGQGYIGEAIDTAGGVTYVNAGVAGVSLQNLIKFGRVPQFLAQYVDHVVIHCLTNDLYNGALANLAAAQALVLAAVQAFYRPDGKLWFCTILPRTTSTDSWATYANQTTSASYEALRVTINNWMRDSTGTGLVQWLVAQGIPATRIGGVIEGAALIEHNADGSALVLGTNDQQTTGTGGYYLINATADGIHPNSAGVAVLVPAVPTFALPAN